MLDNQSAIQAIMNPGNNPGQYIIQAIHSEITRLYRKRGSLGIHLAWIAGHKDNVGNEDADKKAKEASEHQILDTLHVNRKIFKIDLPLSKSALKASMRKETTERWAALWASSPRAKFTRFHDDSPPSVSIFKIYNSLPRRSGALFTQLRTGHIGLNGLLYRIGASDTPKCPHCETKESVNHFLLQCSRYDYQRHKLRLTLGNKPLQPKHMLRDAKAIRATLTYTHATNRFPQQYDNLDK
jgi:hypothetical protein